MPLIYDFQLSIPLDPGTAGLLVEKLPATDEGQMLGEWMTADLAAHRLQLVKCEAAAERPTRLNWGGELADEQFYVNFLPLLEYLAPLAEQSGFVGTFHARGLRHPTAIYFCDGQPFGLQLTGVPRALQTGAAMSDAQLESLTAGGDGTDDPLDNDDADE